MFAVTRLKRQNIPLNRNTLRQPFFAQCYVAAPAALMLGLAAILMRASEPAIVIAGLALALASIAWYLRIEIIWLRTKIHMSKSAALGSALATWILATIINSAASFLILGA